MQKDSLYTFSSFTPEEYLQNYSVIHKEDIDIDTCYQYFCSLLVLVCTCMFVY